MSAICAAPHLREALYEVLGRYNRMQEEIDRLEEEGRSL